MENKNTPFYETAISVWTVRDLKKLKIAQDNKLNYIVFWTLEEAQAWIQNMLEI